jgi:hypothetical protein
MTRNRVFRHGHAIVMAAILAAAGTACQTTAAAPVRTSHGATTPGTAAVVSRPPGAHVAALIANARAAQRHGDSRALRGFQSALVDLVGQQVISDARARYQRALADLAAAAAIGDTHARADFRAQLRVMCEPRSLVGAFERCETADLIWGR